MSAPASDLVPVFAALGDETRLALLMRLSRGETLSISNLASGSGLTRQAITKHLRVMAMAGLVHSRKAGRESRFSLQADRLGEAGAFLAAVSAKWDDALLRLQAHLET